MPRMPARCPRAGFEYRAAEPQRRRWLARSARAATRTRAWSSPPGRAPPRSGTRVQSKIRRHAGKYRADRARDAARIERNRRTPAGPRTPQIRTDSPGAESSAARRCVRGVDLSGDVLERGVANVLAVNHINHVLADILGMIPDALQRAHDPHDLERAPDRARVLHHEGDALTVNRLVLFVHHLVFLRSLERGLRIHAGEGIERVMHHLRDLPPQVLYFAVFVRGPLHGGEPGGDVADFFALIADPLEVGDGLDDGDDYPQIPGGRRPDRQYAAALLVDRHFHAVDLVIVGRDRFAQATITLNQGGDRLVQLLLDESAHLQHLIADLLQVFVEAARNMMGEVGRFHKNFLTAQNLGTLKNPPATDPCCARFLPAITPYVKLAHAVCDVKRCALRLRSD